MGGTAGGPPMPLTGPWIQDAVLLTRVAGFLRQPPELLPADYAGLVAESNKQAATAIKEAVFAKGYTADQLNAADNVVRWNTQLGTYFSLLNTGAASEYDDATVDRFDVRREIREASVLMIGGVPVGPPSPATSEVGGIGHGTLTARDTILRDAECRGWFGR